MSDRESGFTPPDNTFSAFKKDFGLQESDTVFSTDALTQELLLQLAEENKNDPYSEKVVWTDGSTIVYCKKNSFQICLTGVLPPVCKLTFTDGQQPQFSTRMSKVNLEKTLPFITAPYVREIVTKNLEYGNSEQKKEFDRSTGEISENQLVIYDSKGRALFFSLDQTSNEIKLIGYRLNLSKVKTEGLRFCAAVDIHSKQLGLLCHSPGVASLETLVGKGLEILQQNQQTIDSATLVIDPAGILDSMGPTTNLGGEYEEKLVGLLPSGTSIQLRNSTAHTVTIS